MANDKKFLVKNGLTTQNISFVDDTQTTNNTITASMLTTDTLSFSGNTGQLFSITDSMTGTIFSVNDISGTPSIEVFDTGAIRLAELSGNVAIGSANTTSAKLFVNGTVGIGNTTITGFANVSSTLQVGGISTFSANVVLGSSGLSANGGFGTAGQVLNSNGSAAYWATAVPAVRVNAQTTTASPFAWNSDSFDQQSFSALANALTINADAGTPTDGRKQILRFKDNATARTLTFTGGATKAFRDLTGQLIVSGSNFTYNTIISKTVYFGCVYNGADDRWDIIAVTQE